MKKLLSIVAACCLVLISGNVSAQSSREHIRNAIRNYGECRTVAITRTGGDLMVYGKNGYASKGCPSSLTSKLSEIHDKGSYIDDVQITENGSWVILYDDNAAAWSNIPTSLERKIREFNQEGEIIDAITLNDDGDWIVVGRTKYAASSSEILQWLKEGEREHGELWTVCITDDALVAVYDNGYRWIGNVPNDLKEHARRAKFDVYRVKMAGSSWFIADKQGHYDYSM